jgi:hypothetical protein
MPGRERMDYVPTPEQVERGLTDKEFWRVRKLPGRGEWTMYRPLSK